MIADRKLLDTKALPSNIRFLTYNIGCLPTLGSHQFNTKPLAPNKERANAIADHILARADDETYDVIAFQEAWDTNVADLLTKKLSTRYPHVIRGINGDEKIGVIDFIVRGGLMFFSRYPIIESYATPYTNLMFGIESISQKGFIAIKCKLNEQYFFSAYTSHMQAGDVFWKEVSVKHGGTSAHRRGEEANLIAEHQASFSRQSPKGYEHLTHLETFTMGDFNMTLADERRMLSVSIGMSNNGFIKDEIKYYGQYNLFRTLEPVVPDNFMEVRDALPPEKGKKKQTNPVLLEEATRTNKYTGTEKNNTISHQSGRKVIDAMTVGKEGKKLGAFSSKIISFESEVALSDHFSVESIYDFTKPYQERVSLYKNSVPQKFSDQKNPSAGSVEEYPHQEKGRFKLFPSVASVPVVAEIADEVAKLKLY